MGHTEKRLPRILNIIQKGQGLALLIVIASYISDFNLKIKV